jgi:three-Cys-motif partner protein
MPERLSDHDPEKWVHQEHTRAKHQILARYLSGWIPILARSAHRAQSWPVRLLLIDGFAGRGRYVGGEHGSPLILAQVANQVTNYLGSSVGAVEIDCIFIEADQENHRCLTEEITRARLTARQGVRLHDPMCQTFHSAIRPLLAKAQRHNGLFVFADPFGFGDIPLEVMQQILALPRSEVFITYMVQYVNRFFEESDRDRAFCSLFGVTSSQLNQLRQQLRAAPDRELSLRDYYMARLKAGAGAEYAWAFRMLPEHGDTTLYYLIHGSRHPKGLRLMKTTMKRHGTQGQYAFYGRNDFARKQQKVLLAPDDPEALKEHLVQSQAGTSVEYEMLLNRLCDDASCYYYVDQDFHSALQALRQEHRIDVNPVSSKTARGLQDMDMIHFPSPPRRQQPSPVPQPTAPRLTGPRPTAIQPRLF